MDKKSIKELLIHVVERVKDTYNKYLLSDEKFIRKTFKKRVGRKLNLKNPVKYNDKLQWLKLYWYDSLATQCADKYLVRSFIEEQLGSKYLNKLLGVYESVDEINLDELPKSFVLKGTHGSGYNIICKDKEKMNWKREFKKMRRWMKQNYYWRNREWVYKDIKPRIICEEYMEETESGQLKDYKIFCFNGEPKIIEVDFDRYSKLKRNLYDLDWNLLDIEIGDPSDPSVKHDKPDKLKEMISLSKKLSKKFPHVRVDFYNLNNQIIFGELTFFHYNGMANFNPAEFERKMGSYLTLPEYSDASLFTKRRG